MKVTNLELEGLKLIHLDVHGDGRGFFVERFQEKRFAEHGLPTRFIQDNHSRSAPRVLRGLHYQFDPPQGKLVGVTRGRIYDVVVDIRATSPTFGRWVGVELTAEGGELLWVPAGFAHGFCVLGDELADVLYKVDGPYNRAGEEGLAWNDPEIGVRWPIADPILSGRDESQASFAEYKRAPRF